MSSPAPPRDPRTSWPLPAWGELAVREDLGGGVVRILAPNPSPMTLDGTNTYVVAGGGQDAPVVIVDPGPDDDDHLLNVLDAVGEREVRAILVTHRHHDHAEAAGAWAMRLGCRVHAPDPRTAGEDGVVIGEGDHIAGIGVVATPGHTADHVAFRLSHGPLLTGDHILGRGTSVVAHPDGDLEAYLASLTRVLDLGPDALFPGHGPALVHGDPGAVVRYYRDHRHYRLEQITAALRHGPLRTDELVERIYVGVDPVLLSAAMLSTRAALEALERRGEVAIVDDVVRLSGGRST